MTRPAASRQAVPTDGPALAAWWPRVVAVAVPTAAVGTHALLYGRWIVDDAGITFAYARSIATGEGPVLQPGAEPVEGFSNPAWLGLLVLARWLGLFDRGTWLGMPDYVAFPKLLALVLVAGMFACFHAVAATVTRRPVPVPPAGSPPHISTAQLPAGRTGEPPARTFRAAPTAPLCLVTQNTGGAINSYAEVVDVPDPVLTAPDIGGAALVSDLRVVDLVRLADRRIARFWAAGDMAGLRAATDALDGDQPRGGQSPRSSAPGSGAHPPGPL